MKRFEYYTSRMIVNDRELNGLGLNGWELVSHSAVANNYGMEQFLNANMDFVDRQKYAG